MKTLTTHIIRSKLILLIIVVSVFLSKNADAQRGRPYINFGAWTNGIYGTTFVADNGNLLRGMICGSNPASIPQTTNYGCNAVHFYAESASGGTAGYNSNLVDSVVAMTRTNGMYLVITIGGGGVNLSFDTAFWSFYAPRYANETHVIYEIQNEVDGGGPSSSSVIQLETNCYNIIRANAPNTPVLFFSYVAFNNGAGVVSDLGALGSGINWSNAAVAFHGYGTGGPNAMNKCLKYVLGAGYPCFQTEFYRWPWGTGNFPLGADASMYQDETQSGMFERELVSWLTFITINNFTNDARFRFPLDNAGIVWTPDYGSWPAGSRGTFGNGGDPWWNTNISSSLSIQAANYDTGGPGIAFYCPTNYSGNVYRSDDVGIESTADTGGGYDVTALAPGEWFGYTTYINNAGYYYLEMRVASAQPTNQLDISFYEKNTTNGTGVVTFPGTGGSQVWTTITNIVFLPPGQQIMNLGMLSSGFNVHWVQISPLQPGTFTNGIYKIINLNSGMAMEETGTSAGSKLDENTYSGATSQQWNIGHVGGNEYYFTNVESGLLIDELTYTALSGDYIQVYTPGSSINQRWIPMPTAGGYYKLASVNSGLVLEVSTNGSSIDQSEFANGGQQQWAILPLNANPPVGPPTGLSGYSVSDQQIDLGWTASSGATSYNVKRSTTSGGPYTTIATGVTTTSYQDTGLSPSTTYYYVVSAVSGGVESGDSAEANAATMVYGTAIVDNADPTGVSIVGTWTSSKSTPGYYRTNYINDGNTGSVGGKSVTYMPTLSATGNYNVYMNWPSATNRASNTPVDVIYNGGTNTYSIDQQVGGSWQLIGNFSFNAGTTGSFKIRNDGANGYVIADAIKWVLTSSNTPPAAPTGLSATAGNTVVNLSWTQSTSPGITGNNVYRSATGSGGPYNLLANLLASTSYSDTAVVNGSTYFYTVTAVNGNGEGAMSAYAGATPTGPPPAAPTGLSATAVSSSQVNLSWTASSGATSYNVKRATVSGGPYTTIASDVTSTSYNDTTAAGGTTYYYVVSAVNGGGESANSTQANATTIPAAPTGLSPTAGNNQVALSWTASTGAASYNVKRATVSGGPYTTIASGVTTASYTDTTDVNGTTYYYVVSAVNGSGESANSSQVSATPSAPTAPAAPTGLSASAPRHSTGKINLAWTQSTSPNITTNNIYQATVNGGPYTKIASIAATTTYTSTGLTSGTTYYYVVTAVNSSGLESVNSNQASATSR